MNADHSFSAASSQDLLPIESSLSALSPSPEEVTVPPAVAHPAKAAATRTNERMERTSISRSGERRSVEEGGSCTRHRFAARYAHVVFDARLGPATHSRGNRPHKLISPDLGEPGLAAGRGKNAPPGRSNALAPVGQGLNARATRMRQRGRHHRGCVEASRLRSDSWRIDAAARCRGGRGRRFVSLGSAVSVRCASALQAHVGRSRCGRCIGVRRS